MKTYDIKLQGMHPRIEKAYDQVMNKRPERIK